jgi:hypothetical protein
MTAANGRLRRLTEELVEAGLALDAFPSDLLVEEIDHALRPPLHERRVSSSGTIVHPTTEPDSWSVATGLQITRAPTGDQPLDAARRFADGLSSWILRLRDEPVEWLIFDRPVASERDLTIVARATGAAVVQRHPAGLVRVVTESGLLRWDGYSWHHEPPVGRWIDVMRACNDARDTARLRAFLEFAVHDLGANGIGALLVYREVNTPAPAVEERLPVPPPLTIDRPMHLGPLRHALAQIDGAAVFDAQGVLRQLGARLIPSTAAEEQVDGYKGTRHISGLRYSYDDPTAIVIAVSEDGPVSVFQNGTVLGHSDPD